MNQILCVLEHDGHQLRPAALAALEMAHQISAAQQAEVHGLLLGYGLSAVELQAQRYVDVLTVDHADLAHPLADRLAAVVSNVVRSEGADLVIAATSSWSKDVLGRAGGLLGGAMASEVVAHQIVAGCLQWQRPMYAGALLAWIRLHGHPQLVTMRAGSYPAARERAMPGSSRAVRVLLHGDSFRSVFEQSRARASHRPDVSDANIVVSGGRAVRNSDDYERLVGGLADALGAATGSSRALVDAGITANELQVGQTGKIISPAVYIALGISGAVQHLAGMKNSKCIVAVNQDADAPIFDVADYGLVGDIYEIVPQLIQRLKGGP